MPNFRRHHTLCKVKRLGKHGQVGSEEHFAQTAALQPNFILGLVGGLEKGARKKAATFWCTRGRFLPYVLPKRGQSCCSTMACHPVPWFQLQKFFLSTWYQIFQLPKHQQSRGGDRKNSPTFWCKRRRRSPLVPGLCFHGNQCQFHSQIPRHLKSGKEIGNTPLASGAGAVAAPPARQGPVLQCHGFSYRKSF